MIIKGAYVYTKEGSFAVKDVAVKADEIAAVAESICPKNGEKLIDGEGCYLIPGLTDIHFHGCVGRDLCDASETAIDEMAAYQARMGVTSIVPATMTVEEELLSAICERTAGYLRKQAEGRKKDKAVLCGIYMEGPFLSKEKRGAQKEAFLRKADSALFERMQAKSGGAIKLVAIAPETEGAVDFIRMKKEEAVISLAHTMADYHTAMEAFRAGAAQVTHLYNAMRPFSHRDPGVIGAAADAGVYTELICDGIHVHPSAVRAALKLIGEEKVIFVSDSMMATGLWDGEYTLGGQSVVVKGRLAVLQDKTIAGSVTNLMDCMRLAVKQMGVPLETAVRCAAVNPAKAIGIYDKYGSISPGKKANMVLLDKEELHVKQVILAGELLKENKAEPVGGKV